MKCGLARRKPDPTECRPLNNLKDDPKLHKGIK
jgi:hypothetical protein